MSNGDLVHYFLPAVRQGLAVQIAERAKPAHRASISVELTVEGKAPGQGAPAVETVTRTVSLYGPGDVPGFDGGRIVARTDPKPDVGDFEPNYFPCVEFVDADFPWRFTADQYARNRLDPWIVLVVLANQAKGEIPKEFDEVRSQNPKLPRRIKVIDTGASLPNLNDAWRWAHVRVTAQGGLSTRAQIEEVILKRPGQAVSVLHCPRRLAPGVQYSAFVVPAFRLGLDAALGQLLTPEADAADPAWRRTETNFELPYFYRWDFGTGRLGDFERLVRLLEPRELTQLGTRPIDCTDPGFGLSGVHRLDVDDETTQNLLDLEGALQSLDTEYTPWGYDAQAEGPPAPNDHWPPNAFQKALADLLNRPNTDDLASEARDVQHNVDEGSSIDATQITWEYLLLENELVVRWGASPTEAAEFRYGEIGKVLQSVGTDGQSATVGRLAPERDYRFEILASDKRASGTFRVVLPQVVPPAYGRWHLGALTEASGDEAGKKLIVDPGPVPGWLEELNLDPRHRTAAGLGAEVVRKNQEPLMASAWQQLGEIERANDILRRAQLGRDSGASLHRRLGDMRAEDFLRVTRAAQRVVFFAEPDSPRTLRAKKLVTAATYLGDNTRIPAAVLDPAFRRIASPRRAIRARQLRKMSVDRGGARAALAWPEDMLQQLLAGNLQPAGPARKPLGVASIAEISKALLPRSSSPELDPGTVEPRWRGGAESDHVRGKVFDEPGISKLIKDAVIEPDDDLPDLVKDVFKKPEIGQAVVGTFAGWLDKTDSVPEAPKKKVEFLQELKRQIRAQLDPKVTIVERTRSRFRWAGVVQHHFKEGKRGDPLDPILWAPEFDYPMYEPLLELGHAALLPGVEKIPQNTIGVLKANRRFIEAYLAGCNHEFAGELLWRGYPTDQRGTYFRQFWDVSERLSSPKEEEAALSIELRNRGYQKLDDMPTHERLFVLASDLSATCRALSAIWASDDTPDSSGKQERRKELLQSIENSGAPALSKLDRPEVEGVVRHVLIELGLASERRDIRPLTQWPAENRLGKNGRVVDGGLILVIRGDLLKRYPNALIYAVDEVEVQDGTQRKNVPGLHEFLPDGQEVPKRIYPIFSASMPPDLMFFGFPFSEESARGETQEAAKFFVMEQAPGEPRHGLDESDAPAEAVDESDDLTWASFGFGAGAQSRVGAYLDDPVQAGELPKISGPLLDQWMIGTSAHRARVTWQKPVRIVVGAKQLLPRKS